MVHQGKVFFSIPPPQAFAAAHPFPLSAGNAGDNGGDECGPRTITVEAPCPTVPASTVTSTVTDTITPTPETITNIVTDTITAPPVTVTDTVTQPGPTVFNTIINTITGTLTDTTTAPGATVTMDITSINISADITEVPGPTAAAPTGAAHPGAINYGSYSDPTINWESGPRGR